MGTQTTMKQVRMAEKVKILKDRWYSAREAADLLKVTEETVKKYCRNAKMTGKQVGPKKRWHVRGVEIMGQRKAWGLDDIQG